MKKILNNLSIIILILVVLIGCDIYSINKREKPIFVINEETSGNNKIYRGILYDTYDCEIFSSMQIKLKTTKYNCPVK